MKKYEQVEQSFIEVHLFSVLCNNLKTTLLKILDLFKTRHNDFNTN